MRWQQAGRASLPGHNYVDLPYRATWQVCNLRRTIPYHQRALPRCSRLPSKRWRCALVGCWLVRTVCKFTWEGDRKVACGIYAQLTWDLRPFLRQSAHMDNSTRKRASLSAVQTNRLPKQYNATPMMVRTTMANHLPCGSRGRLSICLFAALPFPNQKKALRLARRRGASHAVRPSLNRHQVNYEEGSEALFNAHTDIWGVVVTRAKTATIGLLRIPAGAVVDEGVKKGSM